MVIISKTILNDFSKKQPTAEGALEKWYYETKSADWKDFNSLKKNL